MSEKTLNFIKISKRGNRSFLEVSFIVRVAYLLLLIPVLYLLWEIYWAGKVGYSFIKWHTHIAVYLYLWLCLYFLLYLLNRVLHLTNYLKYQTIMGSVVFIFLISEIALILTGTGDTYTEKIKRGYTSRYDARYEKYYRTHLPNEVFYITRPEFNYIRHCNSLGYADIEWPGKKAPHQRRFACFGDSFTEGVGAPYDSNYVSILRTLLRQKDTDNYVMNAGISGDDPCVNFVSYRDQISLYQPDFIIQTLSSNDINTDIAAKGGLERFQKDKTVKFKSGPWWEPIYALSYVSRLFFTAAGYNELLLKNEFSETDKKIANAKVKESFAAYAQVAQKQGATLIVVLQPYLGEIYNHKYQYDMTEIVQYLRTLDHVEVYDLMPYYMKEFDKDKNHFKNYYWPQDGHHNSKGYNMMAHAMAAAMDSLGISMPKEK